MRKLRNCTTSSLKRWFRLHRWPRCDRAVFDVYLVPKGLDEKVAELHFLLLGAQLTVQNFGLSQCGAGRGTFSNELAILTNSPQIELVPGVLRMKKFLGTVSSWTKRL